MEIENIKTYKKDLLDDIQVRAPTVTFITVEAHSSSLVFHLLVQRLKMEIDSVMAEILDFESAEEK